MANRRGLGPSISFFAFQDIITSVVGIFILITLILAIELAQRVETASSGQSINIAPIVTAIETLEQEVKRLSEMVQARTAASHQTAEVNAFNRTDLIEQLKSRNDAATIRLAQVQAQLDRAGKEQTQAVKENRKLKEQNAALESQRTLIEELTEKLSNYQAKINKLAGDTSPIYRDETEDGRFVVLVTADGGSIEIRDALTRGSDSFAGDDRMNRFESWLGSATLSRRQLFVMIRPGGAADYVEMRELLDRKNCVFGFTVIGDDDSVQLGYEIGTQL